MDGLFQAFQRCLDSIVTKQSGSDRRDCWSTCGVERTIDLPSIERRSEAGSVAAGASLCRRLVHRGRNSHSRRPPRVAVGHVVPSHQLEPLLMDTAAGEAFADQGLADIHRRMLTDEDGDEAHEFIVVDAPPRCVVNDMSERCLCGRWADPAPRPHFLASCAVQAGGQSIALSATPCCRCTRRSVTRCERPVECSQR